MQTSRTYPLTVIGCLFDGKTFQLSTDSRMLNLSRLVGQQPQPALQVTNGI